MELYIVRHGETLWNKERRLQGRTDIELSEYGRDLAKKTGEAMQDINIDVIYSSPLNRAYETALLIRGNKDIPVIKDERIREMSFGAYEGYKDVELNGTSFKNFFEAPDKFVPAKDGETFEEVIERASDFMKELLEKNIDSDKRIMIVAHGAMNKALMMYIDKKPLKDFWKPDLQKNCSAIIVKCNKDNYEIIDENKIFY